MCVDTRIVNKSGLGLLRLLERERIWSSIPPSELDAPRNLKVRSSHKSPCLKYQTGNTWTNDFENSQLLSHLALCKLSLFSTCLASVLRCQPLQKQFQHWKVSATRISNGELIITFHCPSNGSAKFLPFHWKKLKGKSKIWFHCEQLSVFFFSDKQQRTQNETSYIEWNVDLKISRRGTKSVASAYSVLRYVHYERQFLKWFFLFIRVSGSVQWRYESEELWLSGLSSNPFVLIIEMMVFV